MIQPFIADHFVQACPSICYRVAREILGQLPESEYMLQLQQGILADEIVQEVMSWEGPDGWLAWDFHGAKSTEAGIRILCEKGVDRDCPILINALSALEEAGDRLNRGIGKVGKILEDMGFAGIDTIKATTFSYAGVEDRPFIQRQIQLALDRFEGVLAINAVEELVETYRDRPVFRNNTYWPSIYDLRLLAFTKNWRTPENQVMIGDSIGRLVRLSPLPAASVRYRSQLIAPASFCMDDFSPDLSTMDDAHWMMWFHRMELLARLSVVQCVPELNQQVDALREILEANAGKFAKRLAHDYFRKWGAYTGLMLEKDWRDPHRRINDLTFRSLLILYYTDHQYT